MRIAIGLGTIIDDWDATAAYVVEAERLGVDFVWSAENWGHDAATPLAYIAALTEKIQLGSGVMQAPARTPAMTAMTAMSLSAISKGRFVLGLGASGPQVVEGWHGVPFAMSIQRLRETVEIVRIVSAGASLKFQGKVHQLPLPGGEGKALRTSAMPRQFPIYLATLSPRSLELTGALADGWLGTSFIPEHAEVFLSAIRAGAEKVGRRLTDLDVQVMGGSVAFSDDLDHLIASRKKSLAFTLGAMGSRQHNFYNAAYQRSGYVELAQQVQALWLSGKHDEASQAVPDQMVLATNLIGTEEMIRRRVSAHLEAGVTTLRVTPEGRDLKQRLETLARIVQITREVSGR